MAARAFRVTRKGQVSIPVSFRRKYGIRPGTRVTYSDDDGAIRMHPQTPQGVRSLKGIFKGGPSLMKALLRERRRKRAL